MLTLLDREPKHVSPGRTIVLVELSGREGPAQRTQATARRAMKKHAWGYQATAALFGVDRGSVHRLTTPRAGGTS